MNSARDRELGRTRSPVSMLIATSLNVMTATAAAVAAVAEAEDDCSVHLIFAGVVRSQLDLLFRMGLGGNAIVCIPAGCVILCE